MKKRMKIVLAAVIMVSLSACGRTNTSSEQVSDTAETELTQTEKNGSEEEKNAQKETHADSTEAENGKEDTEMKLRIQAGGSVFTAAMEDNEAAEALAEMIKEEPVVIEMDDYSGFEKVGNLGVTLPSSNRQMTTHSGDIVLYNSSQIVMFYGSNSWSYTKLAEIEDLTGWEEALGSGSVTVTFSVEQ